MKRNFPLKIYLVAMLLRLIPVLLTHNLGIGLDDMFQYDMLARSLANGHGFRWYAEADLKQLEPYVHFDLDSASGYDPQFGMYTSFRAPLYPSFLALIYFFAGSGASRFFFARLAQAFLLGAPLAPLTYWTAKELLPEFENEKVARFSAWIVAGYPMLLVYPLGLGTENLFFVLLLASFLCLLKFIKRPNLRFALLSGGLLALTALTRSVILPFAGISILYLIYLAVLRALIPNPSTLSGTRPVGEGSPLSLWERVRVRENLLTFAKLRKVIYLYCKPALWLALTFTLGIAPWIVRNSLLHRQLTGIETSMGYNLYLGYHPNGDGSFMFGPSLDLLSIMDDAQRDELGTQKALEFIRQAPHRFLPLALNRLGFFFGLEKRVLIYFYSNNLLGYIAPPILLTLAFILLLPFVALTIAGVFGLLALKPSPQTTLLLLLFGGYLLPHVFILAEDRFHLALIPYFAILASYGLILFSSRQLNLNRRKALTAMILIGLLLFNWAAELNRDSAKITAILSPTGNMAGFPY
ncbi:MAG: hypothetical protein IT310_09850 [Anaerolineales bacterium]|nr:hypothetical protein [Anaerolineales bacterium]